MRYPCPGFPPTRMLGLLARSLEAVAAPGMGMVGICPPVGGSALTYPPPSEGKNEQN